MDGKGNGYNIKKEFSNSFLDPTPLVMPWPVSRLLYDMKKFKAIIVADWLAEDAEDSEMKSLYIDTQRLTVTTSLNSAGSSDGRHDSSTHVSKITHTGLTPSIALEYLWNWLTLRLYNAMILCKTCICKVAVRASDLWSTGSEFDSDRALPD